MERPKHEGKRNQFQLLRTLSLVNKEFNKTFRQDLRSYEKDIKAVVSLCHFYDLTRQFPQNDFMHLVGVQFILDDPKIGPRSRRSYKAYLENNQFHLFCQHYVDMRTEIKDYPNTKTGFIQLLDDFVPIIKSSVFGIAPLWDMLRPITAFDKKMLKRYRLLQDQTVVEIMDPKVFIINPETISHWDMSYLNQAPWYD